MNIVDKKYILWFGLSILFVALLVIVTFFALKSLRPMKENGTKNQLNQEGVSSEQNVIDPQTIEYKNGGFFPQKIEINSSLPKGCAINLVNSTKKELQIGLSPHNESGDPGFRYPGVKPKENYIFDPRYRIPKLFFHDHSNPSSEFEVILGIGCRFE